MGYCSRVVLCMLYVVHVLLAARANPSSDSHVNKDRVYDIIQSMLGFKERPSVGQKLSVGENAPKYMLDLYELVKNGNLNQQMRGDTVRSVKAQLGEYFITIFPSRISSSCSSSSFLSLPQLTA